MQDSARALSVSEAHNKQVVLEYYELLCGQWNFDAASRHLGPVFRQHNPTIADGVDGLKRWVEARPPFASQLKADIRRILVDGDFVALHTYVTLAEHPAMVIFDLFRLEGGKVVEHWDVIQPEPPTSLHENGMA